MSATNDSNGPAGEALETSLRTTWNARLVEYDHGRFPFAERVLDEARRVGSRLGFDISALDRIHEEVAPRDVFRLTKELCAATRRPEFVRMVHAFVDEEVVPKGGLDRPVAVQRFLNVRVMLPDRPQGVFPFHTGLAYGHGAAARSLWMPLTDVSSDDDATATLQIVDLERSRELAREATSRGLGIRAMSELYGAECHAVRAAPGQVVFFSQEHVHGNFVNRSGRTRVSIDFRVAEARFADRLARKTLGGYFELLGTGRPRRGIDPARLANGVSNVVYLNNNTRAVEGAPVHLQRGMVVERCREHGIPFEFELFELEDMQHLPTLWHVVDELGCNAILYSVFALPELASERARILDAALDRGVALYFVNEDVLVADADDRGYLEDLLRYAAHDRSAAS